MGRRRKSVIWDIKLCNTWINGHTEKKSEVEIDSKSYKCSKNEIVTKADGLTIDHPWRYRDRKAVSDIYMKLSLCNDSLNMFRLSSHQLTEWPYSHFRKLICRSYLHNFLSCSKITLKRNWTYFSKSRYIYFHRISLEISKLNFLNS